METDFFVAFWLLISWTFISAHLLESFVSSPTLNKQNIDIPFAKQLYKSFMSRKTKKMQENLILILIAHQVHTVW